MEIEWIVVKSKDAYSMASDVCASLPLNARIVLQCRGHVPLTYMPRVPMQNNLSTMRDPLQLALVPLGGQMQSV